MSEPRGDQEASRLADQFWTDRASLDVGSLVTDPQGEAWMYVGYLQAGRVTTYVLLAGATGDATLYVKHGWGSEIREFKEPGRRQLHVICKPSGKGLVERKAEIKVGTAFGSEPQPLV
ncbi:MAG: hypothetical protein KF754_01675 [Planctomycetes bacterium]|nr:hypothetical protein [Planctomycetota bacterium]